jgi:ssDNA-binding Zn-finger/Zn-ribbon topoisomerase 1
VNAARAKHGDKFQYDEATYTIISRPLTIRCPIHGEFSAKADRHISSSHGCPQCAKANRGKKHKKPFNDFQAQVQAVFGKKYKLDENSYVKKSQKVRVICLQHGEFWQWPNSLLKGWGCPQCNKTRPMTRERFLQMAKEKHGDKYDYSKIEDITSWKQRVIITCPIHGEFTQRVSIHLASTGCPKCGREKGAAKRAHKDAGSL